MYRVLGGFQNAKKQGAIYYCEEFLEEFETLDKARDFAKSQAGAWDKIIIRNDDEDIEEI